MAGCVPQVHPEQHLMVRCVEVEHPEFLEGRHRESPSEVVRRTVFAEERPVLRVHVVAGIREPRAPVGKARASGVVGMEMRQHDVTDVAR
jgi:hypothetical protein